MKIAVILPSRGLMFSKTAQELLDNLDGYDYEIFFSHGLPIPDCFEKAVERALRGSCDYIWMVEDDMILPPGTLKKLLDANAPVATMDYPVNKEGQGVVFVADGKVLFTGTGCLLINRGVFNIVRRPFFRTDIKWNAVNHGKFIRLTANKSTNLVGYGLHDVTFGIKLLQAGIPISVIGKVGQRKLIEMGKTGSNHGAHQIEEWTKIKPNYLMRRLKSYPIVPLGKLISVQTAEGEITVHPTHAKKLIKKGIATPTPHKTVGIDMNGIQI